MKTNNNGLHHHHHHHQHQHRTTTLSQLSQLTKSAKFNKLKKFFRKRFLTRFLFSAIVLFLLYAFGVFTHLLEKNLSELRKELKVNVEIKMEQPLKSLNPNMMPANKLNFTYLHKAESICKRSEQQQQPPFLVILVKSKISHFDRRSVIRNTWAQLDPFGLIKRVFLIGLPTHNDDDEDDVNNKAAADESARLEMENDKYGDIVQQDFLDVYYNNTLKTFMGIRWVVDYCPDSRFYLFIDDDFYLNPRLLVKYLCENVTAEQFNTFYAGYVFENSSPMRHMISKWYISLKDYPYNKFPPYASAGCYLLTAKSVRLFYLASRIVELFKFDDIYMGILAYKLDIKPVHMDNVYFHAPSYYPSVYASDIIAAHQFEPDELVHIWIQLEKFIKFSPKSYEEYF
jgi:hypothetical protein